MGIKTEIGINIFMCYILKVIIYIKLKGVELYETANYPTLVINT